ncbi:RNA polymerase sigma-70 factor [Cellulophaga sp. L1A9]|uniref:RNA polymerase sigma-70 factor n=1 Tax=Cellulophaga sp. L1A9 TaxID=2686362 RepID=UPI001E40D969|nr:RNA polymerase sigma-70 factor [Cellulophaga sp. L1A9]
MKNLRKGDDEVFRLLYKQHYKKLCAYTYGLSKDKILSEDIVQNVFFNLWKNRKKIEITNSLNAYLFKACYNEFIDTYKKKQKKIDYLAEIRISAMDFFIEDTIETTNEVKITSIKKAIEKLPNKCKEVFIMIKIEGLKYKEVADNLKISIKTVEAHMSLALRKIKEQI